MKRSLLPLIAVLFVAACGHDIHTPVAPEQLKNLFEWGPAASLKDAKSYCDAQGTQGAVAIDSQGNNSGHDYAQGGGCVARPIAAAWAASRAREAFHWDRSDLDEVRNGSVTNQAFQFFSVQSAGPSIFRQHWTIQWDHFVVDGTSDAPKRILIQYQKTDGTSHIRYWAGAVTLEQVTDNVTSVSMRNEIDADQTDANDAANAVRDYIGKLRTL